MKTDSLYEYLVKIEGKLVEEKKNYIGRIWSKFERKL